MQALLVRGGSPLHGTIEISGAKNAALGILAASIMTDEDVLIENLPDVRDIIQYRSDLPLASEKPVILDGKAMGFVLQACDHMEHIAGTVHCQFLIIIIETTGMMEVIFYHSAYRN